MSVGTYALIERVTLGSAVSSVTFSSIPQTFTDLVLVCQTKITTGGATNDRMRFNGDTGSNYSYIVLYGTGSAAGSYRGNNDASGIIIDDVTSTNFNTTIINIQDYSNTTTNKTVILRSSPIDSAVQINTGLWRSNAAINQITITASTGGSTFVTGSTFRLYGIQAGNQ